MRQIISASAALVLLVSPAVNAQSSPQGRSPARRYAAVIAATDSTVTAILDSTHLREDGEHTAPTDRAERLARIRLAAVQLHQVAGDFDAITPPATYARVHAQMNSTLHRIDALWAEFVRDESVNCDYEYEHALACDGPERRLAAIDEERRTVLPALAAELSDFDTIRDRAYRLLGVTPPTSQRAAPPSRSDVRTDDPTASQAETSAAPDESDGPEGFDGFAWGVSPRAVHADWGSADSPGHRDGAGARSFAGYSRFAPDIFALYVFRDGEGLYQGAYVTWITGSCQRTVQRFIGALDRMSPADADKDPTVAQVGRTLCAQTKLKFPLSHHGDTDVIFKRDGDQLMMAYQRRRAGR